MRAGDGSGTRSPHPGAGRRWAGALAALLGALLATACATTSPGARDFHRHFEAGRYRSAMELYRTDSTLRTDPEVMTRAGLLYASPASPVYDPDRALRIFDRLRSRHPASASGRTAEIMVPLLRKVRSLETAVDSLVSGSRRASTARIDSLSTAADSLRTETRSLRARVRELEAVVGELRTQLRRLKAVDLGENPPPDSTGGRP